MSHANPDPPPLLSKSDPPPFEIVNSGGGGRLILVCDHAGNSIPAALDNLGMATADIARHIAWDIGAEAVTRRLADRLDCVAVICRYSRLVIDCNRRLDHETSIVQESDGLIIPGNLNLSESEAKMRRAAIFHPYHDAIAALAAKRRAPNAGPAIVAIHSFTPEMGGVARPWHVSVLWNDDPRLPLPLLAALRRHDGLTIGDNQPYSGREHYGYSIETHASAESLPNALIEIREDQLRDAAGIRRYSEILGDVLENVLADDNVYRLEQPE